MNKKNVLIFPSGSENAIEIYKSLKYSVHLNVLGGSSIEDHSSLIYEKEIIYLPFLNELSFLESLNQVIKNNNIDYIFPTHDTVANVLSFHQEEILCKILTADMKTNDVARYKAKTYEVFKGEDFCCEVYNKEDDEIPFPIISKPDVGEGAKGVHLISSKKELEGIVGENDVLVEYLPGQEYTVDCFTNSNGELLFSAGRLRENIKMGISFKSRSVDALIQERINIIAEKINSRLTFKGLWFFQLKEDSTGMLKLLEVCTRTAGTMGYFRHLGVNLPLLTVMDAMGIQVSIRQTDLFSTTLYRSTKNRYKYSFDFTTVYVDYDDTIIVNEQVNTKLLQFLYQCKNKDVNIILLTKHSNDLFESFEKFSLSSKLFDEIHILELDEKKSDYIKVSNSIFIDNWFKEREEVSRICNIPVFDLDVVESLIIE